MRQIQAREARTLKESAGISKNPQADNKGIFAFLPSFETYRKIKMQISITVGTLQLTVTIDARVILALIMLLSQQTAKTA